MRSGGGPCDSDLDPFGAPPAAESPSETPDLWSVSGFGGSMMLSFGDREVEVGGA